MLFSIKPAPQFRREPAFGGAGRGAPARAPAAIAIPRIMLAPNGAHRLGNAATMARAGTASALGHAATVALILAIPALLAYLHMHLRPVLPPPPRPPATVEMIMMKTPSVGSSVATHAARAAAPTPKAAKPSGSPTPLASQSSPDTVAPKPDATDPQATPTETSPSDAPAEEQAAIEAPEVNLDLDSDEAPGVGIAEGDNVIPASPDAKHPNLPPSYPREAVIHGEQGTVGLIIDIGPDGAAQNVTLASSSGYATLDNAAKRAVEKWHFRPSLTNGKPVASVFNQQISFGLEH